MDKAERDVWDKAERLGYLAELRRRMMLFCIPLWWGDVNRKQIFHNSSACAIATPEEHIVVTADHVLKTYERQKADKPETICHLGNAPFAPESNVIDRSGHWDLATFRIPKFTLNHWDYNHKIYRPGFWPPPTVNPGDLVIIGGWPEGLRTHSEDGLSSALVTFIGSVESSSDSQFGFQLDLSNTYWPQGESLPPNADLSGASGGPCFLITPGEDRIELKGFIYESGAIGDIVLARHANLIDAKGKIKTEI